MVDAKYSPQKWFVVVFYLALQLSIDKQALIGEGVGERGKTQGDTLFKGRIVKS